MQVHRTLLATARGPLRSVAMKSQKAVSLLFSVVVIGACASLANAAWAAQGSLMFHGSVVNAGCNGRVLNTSTQASSVRTLQAGPNVFVDLLPGEDACRPLATPLQASYSRLDASQSSAQAGLVTLTYN
jgi:hypothetical protein